MNKYEILGRMIEYNKNVKKSDGFTYYDEYKYNGYDCLVFVTYDRETAVCAFFQENFMSHKGNSIGLHRFFDDKYMFYFVDTSRFNTDSMRKVSEPYKGIIFG